MELLRTDTTFRFAGLSRNGWVSIAAVALGLAALYWLQRRGETRTLVGPQSFLAPGEATAAIASPSGGGAEPSEAKTLCLPLRGRWQRQSR